MAINNLRTFVFPPSDTVRNSVKVRYGERAHQNIGRVKALFDYMAQIESTNRDAANLDPRLQLPLYLQNGQEVTWYTPGNALVDVQKKNDLRILIDDFARRSGDFFETRKRFNLQ